MSQSENIKKGASVRAFIFVPLLDNAEPDSSAMAAEPPARLREAQGLALAIHLAIINAQCVNVHKPSPGTLFGKGRVEEIGAAIAAENIALVIIDHPLTPVQQRNLEQAWTCKVIDRTALILEIFGERARTKEGVLQVELAHLSYQKGRLVRSWTHLERQRGGGGFLGGPGETQIEADRRILQDKITRLKRELARIVKTRTLHRAKRKKAPYPVIALVGYTNAGKSTLFNRLTGASVTAENMLFATLDPTLRRIHLPAALSAAQSSADENSQSTFSAAADKREGQTLILSDTVGFIAHLPTHLVAAFRATLEEVVEADLILHVRDMANPDNAAHKHNVVEILRSLNVDTENQAKIAEIWNKADLLEPGQRQHLELQAQSALLPTVLVSAQTGEGITELQKLIRDKTLGAIERKTVRLAPQELSLMDWLYRHGVHERQKFTETGGLVVEAALAQADWAIFAVLRRKLRAERGLNAAAE